MNAHRPRRMTTARLRFAAACLLPAMLAGAVAAGPKAPAASPALLRMHDDFVLAFIDSRGFGMRRLPAMGPMLHKTVDGTPWFVADLQLIGVAKHDPPRVFGGGFSMDVFHRPDDHAPLDRGPGRPITAEERRALRTLDAGERLVVVPDGRGLRVTGAIRAGDECLGCHKRKRAGDMLGAFVYRLQPVAPGAQ